MIKVGTSAVYLRSESGDSYLYCFETTTVEHIAEQLRENMEMFCPLCDYKVAGSDKDFVSDVKNLMSEIYDESWGRE